MSGSKVIYKGLAAESLTDKHLEAKLEHDSVTCSPAHATPTLQTTGSLISKLALQVLCLLTVWWSAAVLVTVLMKHTVGHGQTSGSETRGFADWVAFRRSFPFPFAITMATNLLTASFAHLLSWMVYKSSEPNQQPLPRIDAAKLVLIGAIQGAEIACNNKSLEYLTISARTMVGSCSILFMVVTAKLWGLEQFDAMRLAATMLLMCGGILQGLDAHEGNSPAMETPRVQVQGAILLVLSMTFGAQRWALIQHVLHCSPPGSVLASLKKLQLTARTTPVTSAVCFALACAFEREAFYRENWHSELMVCIVGISVGITALTVAELRLVELTSAVAMNVLATLHQVPIVVAGVALFHDSVSVWGSCGFVVCIIGALIYSRAPKDVQEIHSGTTQPTPGRMLFAHDAVSVSDFAEDLVDESVAIRPGLYGLPETPDASDSIGQPARGCMPKT